MGVALAGCGDTVARDSGGPSPCGSVPQLDKMVVQRTDSFPQNHFRFDFPALVTVTAPARVQGAARALCGLPAMPTGGAINCPADFGISYSVELSAGGEQFALITVDATGCQTVRGVRATASWAETSPGFWQALGNALGLAHPDYPAFRGTGPA